MIDVQHVSKRYGKIEAVKDVSFQVEKGSLFAFLGTNGAGKSTTISMLTTLVEPTSGVIKINGTEVNSVKAMHEANCNRLSKKYFRRCINGLRKYSIPRYAI